jgi:HTH-type transcriptional regulator/antitoxin HigA
MSSRKTKTQPAEATASYLALVRRCPLRPIRSEAELDRATIVMNELVDREHLDPAEDDYLDVLSDLVERYEEKAHPIPDVSEGDMLDFLIEQRGVKQANVARGTGIAESTISQVIRGKRRLTRDQLEKLSGYFHVSAAVFLPEADGNGAK